MTMGWRAIIHVEGKTEVRFLHCYLQHLQIKSVMFKGTSREDTVLILPMGNKTPGKEALEPMRRQMGDAPIGLFLIDADDDFNESKQMAEKLCFCKFEKWWPTKTFAYFLTPNNGAKGDMETLLRAISAKQDIYACLDQCKKCLTDLGHKESPDKKGEIYAYCQAAGDKPHPEDRDYSKPEIWDLESEALTPLKDFLTQHLR